MEETDSCQRGGGWMKEGEGLVSRRIGVMHGRRQRCGMARGEGRPGWRWAKGGHWDNYNCVNNKIELKTIKQKWKHESQCLEDGKHLQWDK